MFIMNQSKTSLVSCDGRLVFVANNLVVISDAVRCFSEDVCCFSEGVFYLGKYESNERAKEVLWSVRIALSENRKTFIMPER